MRRVVITGIGIISPIGNNATEVEAILRAGKSGIVFAPDYAEHGFRSQVHGMPQIVLEDHIDKRNLRFMGPGAAYNFLAMEQAIADSGLEESDVSNERSGLIMGSGGPSTSNFFQAHQIVIEKGSPKRMGPFMVTRCMSSTNSACLATPFKIKGVNYSITSACSTSRALHRQRHRTDPDGQAGHRLRRRRRGTGLDALVPLRRDGRDVVEVQRHARDRVPRLRRDPRRLRHRRRRRGRGAGGTGTTPRRAAPRSTPRSRAMAPPRTATTWWRPRARAANGRCGWRSSTLPEGRKVDYINAHGTSTPGRRRDRGEGGPPGLRRGQDAARSPRRNR